MTSRGDQAVPPPGDGMGPESHGGSESPGEVAGGAGDPPEARPAEQETVPLTRASVRAAEHGDDRQRRGDRWRIPREVGSSTPVVSTVTVGTAVALAVLVGLAALAGVTATALAVGFAAVVLAWGWMVLTDAPSARSASVVVGVGGVAICLTAGLTQAEPYLQWVPVSVAVAVIAVFLNQVLRPEGRPRLTEGAASSVAALALVASGSTMIPLPRYPAGGHVVLLAMAAVAVAALGQLLLRRPGSAAWVMAGTVILGGGAALLVAAATGLPLLAGAGLGVLVSAVCYAMLRVLVALPLAREVGAAAAAGSAAPLVVGVVGYLAARLIGG